MAAAGFQPLSAAYAARVSSCSRHHWHSHKRFITKVQSVFTPSIRFQVGVMVSGYSSTHFGADVTLQSMYITYSSLQVGISISSYVLGLGLGLGDWPSPNGHCLNTGDTHSLQSLFGPGHYPSVRAGFLPRSHPRTAHVSITTLTLWCSTGCLPTRPGATGAPTRNDMADPPGTTTSGSSVWKSRVATSRELTFSACRGSQARFKRVAPLEAAPRFVG